jgi:hypothetical protein
MGSFCLSSFNSCRQPGVAFDTRGLTPCEPKRYNWVMKRAPTNKTAARSSQSSKKAKRAKASPPESYVSQHGVSATPELDSCRNCAKDLSGDQRALFVEEEVGRVFCSESCIAAHFAPDIERLEKEFMRRLSPRDLSGEERESVDHLRWITLQEPDEVWREKTLTGDFRYTLISEFQPGDKKIWSVCICLFLRGEPSFLYLAFPTKNSAMVNHYRRGERIEWSKPARQADLAIAERGGEPEAEVSKDPTDRLADPWTEEETLRAQLVQDRDDSDIPSDEYADYQDCLEEVLDGPDEVWTLTMEDAAAIAAEADVETTEASPAARLFHFIKHYADKGFWYVVIARETDDEEEIELLDAFPTRDASLVDRHRRGSQDSGTVEVKAAPRIIH